MRQPTRRVHTSLRTEFRSGEVQASGEIRNVSEGGMFVHTASLPSPGDCVRLRFQSPFGQPLDLLGLVWWRTGPGHRAPGFGLRLVDDSAGYARLVQALQGRPPH